MCINIYTDGHCCQLKRCKSRALGVGWRWQVVRGIHGRLGEEETIHTHTHTQPRDTQKMASSYLVVTIKLNSTHKSSSCSSTLFFTWPSSPLYFFKTSVFIFQSGELNEKSLKKKKNKVETQKTHWKIIHETDNRVKMVPNITWGS
jgi:hypothetical protein